MPLDLEDQLVAVGRWLDDASYRPRVQPEKQRRTPRLAVAAAAMVLLAVGLYAIDRDRGRVPKVSTSGPTTIQENVSSTTTSSPGAGSSTRPTYQSLSYSRDADGTRRLEFHFTGRVDDIPVVALDDLLVAEPDEISLGQQPQTGEATICGNHQPGVAGSVELRFPAGMFSGDGSSERPDLQPSNDVEQFRTDGMIGNITACPIAGQFVRVWIALEGQPTLGNLRAVAVGETVILTIQPDLAKASDPAEIRTLPLFMPTTGDVGAPRVAVAGYRPSPIFSYGHPTPDGGFDRLVWVMVSAGMYEATPAASDASRAVRNVPVADSTVEISATGPSADRDVQAIAEAIKSASTDRVVAPGRVGDLVRYVNATSRHAVMVTSGSIEVMVMRSSARLPLGDPIEAVARIAPLQVRGHDGWAVYGHDGRRLRVAWQEAPDARVVVSFYETRGDGPYVDPLDVANALRPGTPEDRASATELGATVRS
jgi:hypothetical protein